MSEREDIYRNEESLERHYYNKKIMSGDPFLGEIYTSLYRTSRKRLIDAGFDESEVDRDFERNMVFMSDSEWIDKVSPSALKLLAETSREAETRQPIFSFLRTRRNDRLKEILSVSLDGLEKATEENPEVKANYKKFVEKVIKDEREETSGYFGEKLSIGARVVSNRVLYRLFQDDPVALGDFLGNTAKGRDLTPILKALNSLERQQNVDVLLAEANPKILYELGNLDLSYVLKTPDLAMAVRGYLRSPKEWPDKIQIFKPVVGAAGLRYRQGPESDEKLLTRIRVHENPNHVAIRMGLVPTLGWEIEYDYGSDAVQLMKNSGAYYILGSFGFREGGGGSGTDEASPGPCYSPETLTAIFDLYSDTRIIDARAYSGMTEHMNIGGITEGRFVEIVRASYLTGASLNPFIKSSRDVLHIQNHYGDYKEGKVYAVMDDDDFKWNFNASARLAAAAKAHTDRGNGLPGEQWRQQLGELWEEFEQRFDSGLSFLGRSRYRTDKANYNTRYTGYTDDFEWNRDQLRRIYKDQTYTVLPDLEKIGQMDPNTPDPSGIQGVMVEDEKGQTWYPNIAIFARSEMDKVVAKIEAVFQDIDKTCITDIRDIENLSGDERLKKIDEFNTRYGIRVDFYDSPHGRIKAYEEVRDLMLLLA